LFWARDFAHSRNQSDIDVDIVNEAMDNKGICSLGLIDMDRKYIKILFELYDGGPSGLQTLASSLNTVEETLKDSVEPYLLQIGLLGRGASGRFLTTDGLAYARKLTK